MPKRKRPGQSDPKTEVREKLDHSKKILQRALKLAKGFERQKLGKRLKLAQSKNEDVSRINREIEAWKGVELSEAAENYLYARLSKIKRLVESGLLPEDVLRGRKEKEGLSEEEKTALNNVTSGMYNMKCVKEAMEEVLRGLYLAMGIPMPEEVRTGKKGKKEEEEAPKGILKASKMEAEEALPIQNEEAEGPAWDGFESGEENRSRVKEEGNEDMDSEDLSRYDALLGSSDSDASEDDNIIQRPTSKTSTKDLSVSPSPSASPPPPTKHPKSKPKSAPPKSTTFLPSLLGGYFSGSESASDIEDARPAPRKNRPGQMARRAIAEKKFGQRANHIASGQPKVAEMGKKGREAKERNEKGWNKQGRDPTFSRGTGDNAIEVKQRKRGAGRKDDVGVLHPSWQAAKAAKEAKQTVAFAGKKVTFD